MHLILTGATGLVGSGCLDAMLRMKDITKISILTRRDVKFARDAQDPRVNVIINKDFVSYEDETVINQLRGAQGCVWALGISQTQVSSPEEYEYITKTMALKSAEIFSTKLSAPSPSSTSTSPQEQEEQQPFRFVYVAGGDTTHQPGIFTSLQARVKGETELELAALQRRFLSSGRQLLAASTVRPWGVDAKHHPAIQPYIPSPPLWQRMTLAALGPVIRNVYKPWWSPTKPLGELLVEIAMGKHDDVARRESPGEPGMVEVLDGGFAIYENAYLRKVKGF